MLASTLSATLMLLAFAQVNSPDAECSPRGPKVEESAWSATVKREQPRVHFLKSREEDGRCPSMEGACEKRSFVVPGDHVLAWARWGDVVCAMYTSNKGVHTVGRIWVDALDYHGSGMAPTASDWSGHWVRDDEADITIRRLDDRQLEIEGAASWGGHDPVRVENGGVHVGEIALTQLRPTGYVIHFVAGSGNSPPAAETEYECIIDLKWQDGTLLVEDSQNGGCGGMNVTFTGTYERVTP